MWVYYWLAFADELMNSAIEHYWQLEYERAVRLSNE
jgi:hypothetical protein